MKKGGKVKQKQKQKQKQQQVVNVYVGKKQQKSTKSSQAQPRPFRPFFAMQDSGFIRLLNPSMQPVPGQPATLLTQSQQLNAPIALNQPQQEGIQPLPAFQPQPPPRVIPGLFPSQPIEDQFKKIEEEVKHQQRFEEEQDMKQALKEDMEATQEAEAMQAEAMQAEAPQEEAPQIIKEDDRITRLRDELNRMHLQPKNPVQIGLRRYARENDIIVPKDASKAQVIDLIIQRAEENPDAFYF